MHLKRRFSRSLTVPFVTFQLAFLSSLSGLSGEEQALKSQEVELKKEASPDFTLDAILQSSSKVNPEMNPEMNPEVNLEVNHTEPNASTISSEPTSLPSTANFASESLKEKEKELSLTQPFESSELSSHAASASDAESESSTSLPLNLGGEKEEENKESKSDSALIQEFTTLLATLALFVVALFFIGWSAKRMMRSKIEQVNAASAIKLMERRPLSPKTNLHWIHVHRKGFLIAESPTGVVKLGEVDLEP